MCAEHSPKISAKEAIKKGLHLFDELFDSTDTKYVLLDGVEFDESTGMWIVTVGFDIGRNATGGIGMFAEKSTPIREKRRIFLNGDSGEFVRMS